MESSRDFLFSLCLFFSLHPYLNKYQSGRGTYEIFIYEITCRSSLASSDARTYVGETSPRGSAWAHKDFVLPDCLELLRSLERSLNLPVDLLSRLLRGCSPGEKSAFRWILLSLCSYDLSFYFSIFFFSINPLSLGGFLFLGRRDESSARNDLSCGR